MQRLLVDTAVLSGQAASLPLAWLDGLEVIGFPPRGLGADVPGATAADALLVRTVTRLEPQVLGLLPRLRAVATLSSGTDHIAVEALARQGIALCTGHGGNAIAVADWVEWAAARLCQPSPGRRALVVGVGAVGCCVAERLDRLGFAVCLCDPPRAEREPTFAHVELDAALAAGGWALVTLHVPKQTAGPHATANLLSAARLERLGGAVVLNAARGGVLDEAAAAALRRSGHLAGLGLDTFIGEPQPATPVIAAADLATPHIAGHSIEGKLRVAHLAVNRLRLALGLGGLPPLEQAVAAAVAASAGCDLDPARQLDAADRALRADPAQFEAIRHAHKRRELALGATGQSG